MHERHEGGHRRGRALVDVRRPGVERRDAGLEEQPDDEQAEPDQQQRVALAGAAGRLEDAAQADRAGVAVEQGEAVEEERRREGAEQEVLHRGFLRQQAPPAGQPGEQVERQREHLQRHEHHQQVVRGREEHHAAEREAHQRERLGLHPPRGGQRPVGAAADGDRGLRHQRAARRVQRPLGQQQHADQPEGGEGAVDEERRAVDGHRPGRGQLMPPGQQDRRDQRADAARSGQHDLGRPARLARHERLDQYAEPGRAEHDQHRGERRCRRSRAP